MNRTEEMLSKKKREIDNINIPADFEIRLSNTLNKSKAKRMIPKGLSLIAAVIILAIALAGYHIDTVAYYYKNLVGYDNVMNGTLKDLNELGKGQIIDKTFAFSNGVSVTLDGIMIDENQLLTFYTIDAPKGNVDDIHMSSSIKGFIGRYYMGGGQGEMNDEGTQIKWMTSFDTPYFFEKRLNMHFDFINEGKVEIGEIAFTLNRSKAMKNILKKQINQSIQVDETNILFKSLIASPTVTSLEGKIQNILDLALDQIKDQRFMPQTLEISLIANGQEISGLGGGLSTDMKGIEFHREYDALPVDLETLQIKLIKFGANHEVDTKVKLYKQGENEVLNIIGQNIKIEKVYESNSETFVTITTEDQVVLTKVYMEVDGNIIELDKTINSDVNKKEKGIITHTRTLQFNGTGDELSLVIKRIKYDKIYDKVIDIPLS